MEVGNRALVCEGFDVHNRCYVAWMTGRVDTRLCSVVRSIGCGAHLAGAETGAAGVLLIWPFATPGICGPHAETLSFTLNMR